MTRKFLLLFLGLFILTVPAQAKLKLPALVGDHMILQQGQPVVWGWADSGQTITASLGGVTGRSVADSRGRWKITLSSLEAGGPHEMTIAGNGEAVTIQDVLVGDLWLGSGQSNMEFALKTARDAAKDIPAANFPKIRLFTVERIASFTLLDDVKGSWKVCTPANAGDFSAVAFYFGREIHSKLKTPVGLVASAWGGTAAESWAPRGALDAQPALASLLKKWDQDKVQHKTWTRGNDFELWLSDIRLIPKDEKEAPVTLRTKKGNAEGLGGYWSTSAKSDSKAQFAATGSGKSGKGSAVKFWGVMHGGAWGSISTPFKDANQAVDLSRYETLEFYAKGSGQFRMNLGQTSITDYDYYSTDVFDATREWKLTRIPLKSLKQGGWGAPKPFTPDAVQSLNFTVQVPFWPDIPSIVYNGMAAPLTPMRIKGVLWYQGESNAGRASQYHLLLSTLIQSWRQAWGQGDFPFLVIQLPNYQPPKSEPGEGTWAELREAQRQTSQDVPLTGLICTLGLGEADNIHPKNKTDVGKRLAFWALDEVYHQKTVHSGPRFSSASAVKGKIIVEFKNPGKGLVARGAGSLNGFAVAGSDRQWHSADAKILKDNRVEVWSQEVPQPAEIRYAWADNPDCNLANPEGWPAFPFQATLENEPQMENK
jgi:sialate O-acetylesterase